MAGFFGDGVGLAAVLGHHGVDVGYDVWSDGGSKDGGQREGVFVGRHVGVEVLDGHQGANGGGGGHFRR